MSEPEPDDTLVDVWPQPSAPPAPPRGEPSDNERYVTEVRERDKAEARRSQDFLWLLGSFAIAYAFIIWSSLYSPAFLFLALLAVPFLPYRWWGILVLVISAVLIFTVIHWSDVHTGLILYRDAREGHWI